MSQTRTRRLAVAAGLLAVVVAALAGWWAYGRFTLNAAERNLVGTWALTHHGVADPGGVLVEIIVREDRTVRSVSRDAKTGAVTLALEEFDWWGIRDGVLSLRERPEPPQARPWYAWWDRPRRIDYFDELRLTPDGPDRLRFTLTRADQLNVLPDPLPTGTWTRVKAE